MKYFSMKQVAKKINRVGNKSSLDYSGNCLFFPQEHYDNPVPLHSSFLSRKAVKMESNIAWTDSHH